MREYDNLDAEEQARRELLRSGVMRECVSCQALVHPVRGEDGPCDCEDCRWLAAATKALEALP